MVFKQPKEVVDLDRVSQDGTTHLEYRKTKKIVELSSFEKLGKQENLQLTNQSAKRKAREGRRLWEEEEKRRNVERLREERERRLYEEEMRVMEQQERFAEIRRYEESIRRDREEEERQKAKKKKKKKPEIRDEYLEDYSARRNDRRMPERDQSAKRRPVVELGRYGTEHAPPTKRRRVGGEVGLSNVLEQIAETLRKHSYPMDLSTIRDKVRRMEYKDREDFRHDVFKITLNAHAYNDGRNPGISLLADQLLELSDYLLDENHESLAEAEAGIES
ncbi:hypothetical protein QYF36_008586 [Acer negundo]|nr:hypothetical protein QYF36_008586 [Acer negundo]